MKLVDSWKRVVIDRYATFDGRASRSEFWWYVLANLIVVFALALLSSASKIFAVLMLIWIVGTLIPNLAVGVRRLHDTNRSGWWYLISIVPFGGIVLFVFFVMEGDAAQNTYGPAPTDGQEVPAAAAPWNTATTGAPVGSGPAPGQWAQDPFGRSAQRYFDGSQWTEHVVDMNSRQATDQPGQRRLAPPAPPAF